MIPIDPIAYLSQYLREHADESISLDDMARITGYSPFHLQRKFKAALGLSPKQFQTQCRLERVKQGLKGQGSVTSAMYDSGFSSSSRLYERSDQSLGMTPAQYKAAGRGVAISWVVLATTFGHVLIAATDRGLCSLRIGDTAAPLVAELEAEFPAANLVAVSQPYPPLLEQWRLAIESFLAGATIAPDLPLDIRATAFEARVWRYLQTIPRGETRSYSEVATAIGAPRSVRAVANACGRNPVALAIPCHRVIRSSGELGGYRWGLERKQRILKAESQHP
jgi:AraC family transcriptional regulator, regulatory protein of adaptative response / methylated-DNA-[protein]-cysteine methyltransferase